MEQFSGQRGLNDINGGNSFRNFRPTFGIRGDDFEGHRIVGFEVEPHSIVQAGHIFSLPVKLS